MNPRERASLVDALGSALSDGEHSLGVVPDLLRQLLHEDAWRDFKTQLGDEVHYDRFEDFVTTPPLKGLGASIDLIRRIVADDEIARDLLDVALQNPVGRPTETFDNIQHLSPPTGTSADAGRRRLRKDRPDLHERVLSGELSVHAAMVIAGFRPATLTVRKDDMQAAARALRDNLDARQIDELVRLLTDDTND